MTFQLKEKIKLRLKDYNFSFFSGGNLLDRVGFLVIF